MKSKHNQVNKSEVIEEIAARAQIYPYQAGAALNAFIRIVYDHLAAGNVVNISGFGQFSVSHREPRLGVNPRNPSQKITIPELNTPKFRAGEAFKEAVKLK